MSESMKELNLEEFAKELSEEGYTDQEIQEFFEDISNMSEEEFIALTEGVNDSQLSRKIYMSPDIDNSIQQPKRKNVPLKMKTVSGPYRGSDDQWDSTVKEENIEEGKESKIRSAITAYDRTYVASRYGHKDRSKLSHHSDAAGESLVSAGTAAILGNVLAPLGQAYPIVGGAAMAGFGAKALYHGARAAYYKGKITAKHLADAKKEYNKIRSVGESTEQIEAEIEAMEMVLKEVNEITSDILTSAVTDSAANLQDTFESALKERISCLVDQRKAELAQEMFAPVQEEVEQIDEISKDKLGRYINKASGDIGTLMMKSGRHDQIARDRKDKYDNYEPENDKIAQKNFDKAEKRLKGIGRAVDRIKDPVYGESEEAHSDRPLDEEWLNKAYLKRLKDSNFTYGFAKDQYRQRGSTPGFRYYGKDAKSVKNDSVRYNLGKRELRAGLKSISPSFKDMKDKERQ